MPFEDEERAHEVAVFQEDTAAMASVAGDALRTEENQERHLKLGKNPEVEKNHGPSKEEEDGESCSFHDLGPSGVLLTLAQLEAAVAIQTHIRLNFEAIHSFQIKAASAVAPASE